MALHTISQGRHVWLPHCRRRLRVINMNRFTNAEFTVVSGKISNEAAIKSANVRSGTSNPCVMWNFHSNDVGYRVAANSTNTYIGKVSVASGGPKSRNQCTGSCRCHRNILINCSSRSAKRSLTSLSPSESSITATR